MREQTEFVADCGQVVESAHRHIDFVSHAAAIHHYLGRIFFNENAAEFANHVEVSVDAVYA